MTSHIPVLLSETIEALDPKPGKFFIDCTFGAGGHTKKLLESGASVLALDRDITCKVFADEIKAIYKDKFDFINEKFSNIKSVLQVQNRHIDGILYDIGISSMHVASGDRGFSFMHDGPLTMQMGLNNMSAYDVVNKTPESELANIIYQYGDEKYSRRIAKAIAKERITSPIETTFQLANIVSKAVPRYNDAIHPATRTFQAIRIHVNNELEEIKSSLIDAINNINKGCKLAVITFHSLEDKIVKDIFKFYAPEKTKYNKYPVNDSDSNDLSFQNIILEILTTKPIIPSYFEVKLNPRSRSAKLRVAVIK